MPGFDARGIIGRRYGGNAVLDRQNPLAGQALPRVRSNAPNGVVEIVDDAEVNEFFRQNLSRVVNNANYTLFHVHVTNAESDTVLQDNVRRTFLSIVNNSTDFVYVNFSQTASAENGYPLAAGQNIKFDPPPVNSIQIIGAIGSLQGVTIVEGST